MVSAINVSSNPSVAGQSGATSALSETGDFDFLSYLLGLQATTSEENSVAIDSGLLAPRLNTEEIALAEEGTSSQKEKELSQWNQIFPGLSPVINSSLPLPLASTKLNDAAGESSQFTAPLWQPAPLLVQKTNEGDAAVVSEKMPASALVIQRNQAMERYASTNAPEVPVQQVAMSNSGKAGKLASAPEMDLVREGESKKRFDSNIVDFDGAPTNQPTVLAPSVPVLEAKPAQSGASVNELFQKVETLFHQGGGKMTVHLSPPELGQVEIQVNSRGKHVSVEMRSDNDFTKSVLESKLGDLRQSLQSQDLVLSKMEVHVSRESSSFGESSFSNFSQSSGAFDQSTSHGFTEQRQQERGFSNPRSLQSERFPAAPIAATRVASTMGHGRVDVRI